MFDLKPCPFCGKEMGNISGAVLPIYIKCPNCGNRTGYYSEIDDAVAAWNYRPLLDPTSETPKILNDIHTRFEGLEKSIQEVLFDNYKNNIEDEMDLSKLDEMKRRLEDLKKFKASIQEASKVYEEFLTSFTEEFGEEMKQIKFDKGFINEIKNYSIELGQIPCTTKKW